MRKREAIKRCDKNGGAFTAGALVGVGPYKPRKVRPSNLNANFVVSPVDSSEEEVRDKQRLLIRFLYNIITHNSFCQDRLGTNEGEALIKTSFGQEEEELRLQEEAQAAAMLAVRKWHCCGVSFRFVSFRFVSFRSVSLRFVPFRFDSLRCVSFRLVSLRCVWFRSVPFRFVSFRCIYEAWCDLT
eukprot:COSAG06_NODE_1321_length_9872_cov_11.153177_3_plen_185_part_00